MLILLVKFVLKKERKKKNVYKQVKEICHIHVSYCSYNQTFGQFGFWTGNSQAKLRKKRLVEIRVTKEHIKHSCNYSILLTTR